MGYYHSITPMLFFRSDKISICIFLTIFLTTLATAGCSINKKPPVESAASRQSQNLFATHNPVVEKRTKNYRVLVRMATRAEIPEEFYKMWALFPAEGAGSLALGLIAPPMYASALVVGGILLIPAGTFGYYHDKKIWESIKKAISSMQFTSAVCSNIIEKLDKKQIYNERLDSTIEIAVQIFGIVEAISKNRACFVVSALFTQTIKEKGAIGENLKITQKDRSLDAPPPQCTSLSQFALDDGRLIKDTAEEFAKVLAVMAVDRIE